MTFIKQLLIAFGAVVGILIAIGLLLPSSVRVERNTFISASPAHIFQFINDLHELNRWSPWTRIDPEASYEFSEPSAGRGAEMRWISDHPNVGTGRMTITESVPDQRVAMELDFGPKGSASTWIRLSPEADGTRVTWGFDKDFGYDLIGRYFGMMLDKMIGADYEKGLNNLKTLLEE